MVRYSRRIASVTGAALLAALGSGLAACSSGDQFAPPCPELSLLRDAADISRFKAGGRDLTDMIMDARITAVPAVCSRGEKSTTKAQLNVAMRVARGPAARGQTLEIPYFIAVTRDGDVLDEQDFRVAAVFPPNTDSVALSGQDVTLNLPVTPQLSAAAYKIYVGFRLTPEELAINRQRSVR